MCYFSQELLDSLRVNDRTLKLLNTTDHVTDAETDCVSRESHFIYNPRLNHSAPIHTVFPWITAFCLWLLERPKKRMSKLTVTEKKTSFYMLSFLMHYLHYLLVIHYGSSFACKIGQLQWCLYKSCISASKIKQQT